MNNLKDIGHTFIYLFEDKVDFHTSNHLKQFIYYMKYKGHRGALSFSFSHQEDTIHMSHSIKDNLILDSIPMSLNQDNENNFQDFLAAISNPYLIKLINQLGDLNRNVNSLTPSEIKLTSLIKALLGSKEFVFLLNPQEYLDDSTCQVLKDCILFEAQKYQRTFYLKSIEFETWIDLATHIISKGPKQLTFKESLNPLHEDTSRKASEAKYHFTLIKAA